MGQGAGRGAETNDQTGTGGGDWAEVRGSDALFYCLTLVTPASVVARVHSVPAQEIHRALESATLRLLVNHSLY